MKLFKDLQYRVTEAVQPQSAQPPIVDNKSQQLAKQRLGIISRRFGLPSSQVTNAYTNFKKKRNDPRNQHLSDMALMTKVPGGKYLYAIQRRFPLAGLEAPQASFLRISRDSSSLREQVDPSSPPAVLNLRRTGIRTFPDGRKVAMYVNKQLGLVFSVPFVGVGQTAGEIIPNLSVQAQAQQTNEEKEYSRISEGSYERFKNK